MRYLGDVSFNDVSFKMTKRKRGPWAVAQIRRGSQNSEVSGCIKAAYMRQKLQMSWPEKKVMTWAAILFSTPPRL
ncbi:hypothetical protein EDC90_101423 [Martelella mediterranea]|uniref:Uncharacterized protein n=1 Tax=Martelella mediterranea TaxID=293089 RepID=A0A4R3NXM2_9HYPH|nr:hypothetical protein EDC90_101423 [Martelella mediterranea]